MKFLLFGKNGQVGWELQRSLALLGHVVALDRHGSGNLCGDLTNLDGLAQTVREVQPDVIINTAAYTAVDRAETEAGLARRVNAEAPAVLAAAARNCGAWIIHYSTDYVFDGSGTTPWSETDHTAPLSVYGQTKRDGEKGIMDATSRYVILRTSWVYAAHGNNFAKTILRLAQERDALNIVADQIGAPTGADLLADLSVLIARKVTRDGTGALSGVYHVCSAGETSWHAYAQLVLQLAEEHGLSLKVHSQDLGAIPSSAYPTPAPRPLNSRLNTSKLRTTFGVTLPQWQVGITRLIPELLQS